MSVICPTVEQDFLDPKCQTQFTTKLQFIVIKSRFILEAQEKWGSHLVESVFDKIRSENPDQVLHKLVSDGKLEERDCLIYLLQNKYGNSN